MIDFNNDVFVKMTPVNMKIFGHEVIPFLIPEKKLSAAIRPCGMVWFSPPNASLP